MKHVTITITLALVIGLLSHPAKAQSPPSDQLLSQIATNQACFDDVQTLIRIEMQDDGRVYETVLAQSKYLSVMCEQELDQIINKYEVFFYGNSNRSVDQAFYKLVTAYEQSLSSIENAPVQWIDFSKPANQRTYTPHPSIKDIRERRKEMIEKGRWALLMAD